jgi:hypothetical protein
MDFAALSLLFNNVSINFTTRIMMSGCHNYVTNYLWRLFTGGGGRFQIYADKESDCLSDKADDGVCLINGMMRSLNSIFAT